MLEQCQSAFITGMYYRDPIDSWTSGRVTLLGDAVTEAPAAAAVSN